MDEAKRVLETNCVQYELILYSRAGPAGQLAAGGLASGAPSASHSPREAQPPAGTLGSGHLEALSGGTLGEGWCKLWDVACTTPCQPCLQCHGVLSPMSTGDRLGDHEGGFENAPHKEGLMQKDLNSCFFIRCPEPRPLHTGRGHSEGSAALCLFTSLHNCCLTASAQPLWTRAQLAWGRGALRLPGSGPPASPGSGCPCRVPGSEASDEKDKEDLHPWPPAETRSASGQQVRVPAIVPNGYYQ